MKRWLCNAKRWLCNTWISIPEWVKVLCVLIVLLGVVFSLPIYWMVLNAIGSSTRYHWPEIATAVPDQKNPKRLVVYLGDRFVVNMHVVRHELNGNCLFEIRRYAEVVEGERTGTRHLISASRLRFGPRGNLLLNTSWPQPGEPEVILGYAVNEDNIPLDGREIKIKLENDETKTIKLPREPLLPDGVDEDYAAFYVVGQYFCNPMDYVFDRFIQGGEPNQTERVYAYIRRHKP